MVGELVLGVMQSCSEGVGVTQQGAPGIRHDHPAALPRKEGNAGDRFEAPDVLADRRLRPAEHLSSAGE